MAPIDRSIMGDVWPAVEPGRQASDYGSARLEPRTPVAIRSWQTFHLTYTVGRFGLDDTGAIRIAMRFVHDGGPLQASDPKAPNYISATASNGVRLVVFPEPYGLRPWYLPVRITVTGGYMREGDEIHLVIGDTRGGSPGFRMQTIAESAFEIKLSVDPCATGQFRDLEADLHLPVVAGPVHLWRLVAPGMRRPGETFDLGIRAEDEWGNPALPGATRLRLVSDPPLAGHPETIDFPEGASSLRIGNLRATSPGTVRFRLLDAEDRDLDRANPLVVSQGVVAGYWGDLHGQSGETLAVNTIEEYLEYARDKAFLDVASHQGNDFQLTTPFWQKLNRVTAAMNEDGRFVVFPGYEWSANTPVGGDHNVFFRHEGRPIRRSSHAMLADRSDIVNDANTLDELFTALSGEDCVLFAHVGGRPADVGHAHSPGLRTAVEVHSNWGTFEWILLDSLALGHRIGIVANSDGHKGRPGAGSPGATEFGAYGGLTCFLAPELTRDAIFEALRRRHHFATSGSRLHLDVRARFSRPAQLFRRDPDHFGVEPEEVREAIMGDIVETAGTGIELSIAVSAGAPIERIDIMNGARLVRTLRTYGAADLGDRVRVTWQGAEYRGRGRNTLWRGEIAFPGARISSMTPINRWNLERELEIAGEDAIVFETVTSGNFAGVDVALDAGETAEVAVATNLVSGRVGLRALGLEDHVLDAGGLERQIRIRRLPSMLEQCDLKTAVELPLAPSLDNPVWVRVQTLDGHLAWSSPIYVRQV